MNRKNLIGIAALTVAALAAFGGDPRRAPQEATAPPSTSEPAEGAWILTEELAQHLIHDSVELSLPGSHGCVQVAVFPLPGPAASRKVMVVGSVFAVCQPPDAVLGTTILPAQSNAPIALVGDEFSVSIRPGHGGSWGDITSAAQIEVEGHEDFFQ